MSSEQYVHSIIAPLTSTPEALTIIKTTDDMGVLYSVHVPFNDMKVVIGKGGETAKAIRQLVRVYGMSQKQRISIKIIEKHE